MERLTRKSSQLPRFKGILYGRPGAGKTTLAATCAYHESLRDVLFVDREGGMLSVVEGLADLKEEFLPLRHRVHSLAEAESIFWQLKTGTNPLVKTVNTVVIDTASELFNLDLEHIVKDQVDNNQKRKGDDADDPQPSDFGKAGRRIARVIRWFRDLDLNLLVLAHTDEIWEKQERDKFKKVAEDDKTLKEVTVGISPMARRLITGFMDFVWLVHVDGDGKRWVLTQKAGPYYAKTRGPLFATRIGKAIEWEEGDPLMSRLYQSLIDGTPVSVPEEKEANG